MKSNMVKLRDYKNNKSLGVSSEIVEDMKSKGHEFFMREYTEDGIVIFTPINVMTNNLETQGVEK